MNFKRYKKILGDTIREHRIGLGYSQESLAAKAGLHRNYVGGIERGERNVSLQNLLRLEKALEIELPELFRDAHDRMRPRR